jgi:hypothetical protein
MTDKVFDIPEKTKEEPPVKEEPKKAKLPKAKKVIDDSTRESLVEKLKQSRKIKAYENETTELKNKIAELEKSKEEKVDKEEKVKEEKPKPVRIPKIKVIDEPVKMEETKVEPKIIVPAKQEIKLAVPEKYIYSTFTRPLWK